MNEILLPRRRFLAGIVGLIAAPAIVRVTSIMPVKAMPEQPTLQALMGADLYGEMIRVTRQAFLPRMVAQAYREPPLFRDISDEKWAEFHEWVAETSEASP